MSQNQVLWVHRTPSNLESGLAGFLTLANGHGHFEPFLLRKIQMGTVPNNLSTPKKQGPTTWGLKITWHVKCTKAYHQLTNLTWETLAKALGVSFINVKGWFKFSPRYLLAFPLSCHFPSSGFSKKLLLDILLEPLEKWARRPEPAQYRPLWHIVFRKSTIVSMNFHTVSLLNSAELSMAT